MNLKKFQISSMKKNFVTRKTLLMRASDPDDQEAWEDFVYYYEDFLNLVFTQAAGSSNLNRLVAAGFKVFSRNADNTVSIDVEGN